MSGQMPQPEELAHQLDKHLQSLRSAGVEWLPKGELARLDLNEELETETDSLSEATDSSEIDSMFSAAALPALPLEQRLAELKTLEEQVAACTRCEKLCQSRTQTVFGDGKPDPDLCFIGEGPGADEDAQGIPFVGAAGQLLNKIITACGFKREDVYICNIVKCRPPGNRTPLVDEADNCREFLEKQLEFISPKYICCLGSCAAQNLLGTTQGVGRLRKRFHDYKGIPVICTYHPAYLLPHRSPGKKRDVWEDMKMLLTHMGRPIPEHKKPAAD